LQEARYLFLGHLFSRTAVNHITLAVQSKMED